MSHVSRLGAFVAASALTVTGLTLAAPPAGAAVQPLAVTQGGSWLAGQLTNGLIHNPNYGGFDDYGLSIDTALALNAVGDHTADVKQIANKIRDNYYNYVTPSLDFGDLTSYGGGIAKALVLAQIAQTAPVSYQLNVQKDLEAQVSSTAGINGRVQNLNETDFQTGDPIDSANVFGQAFAARALTEAVSTRANDAKGFLLAQQCTAGFFRQDFSPKAAVDQSCNGGDVGTHGDKIGATATAVLNLNGSPTLMSDPDVTDAVDAAVVWLKAQQALDGSFNSGNANSTGLAGWVLGTNGEGAAATKAADWLRDRQADNTDACTKLAGAVGAVALNDAGLAAGRTDGIPTGDVGNGKQDEWRRATAQALPALQFVSAPAAATLSLSGPTGFVQASKAASYSVTGAAASSKLCLTVAANYKATTAAPAGTATAALTLPAGTANRTVTVTDRNGNTDTVVTKVLGTKTLAVKPAVKRVKRGTAVWVTVSGLAVGESVTLRYKGVAVATGKANASGAFVRKVSVGQRLGTAGLSATGQFPTIRKGATTITVIR